MAKIKVRLKENSPYSEYGYYRRGDIGYLDGYTNGLAVIILENGEFAKANLDWINVVDEDDSSNTEKDVQKPAGESKDERIRKRIIALVNAHGQGMYKDEMLAWLENQREQKPAECKEDVNCRTTGYWVVSPVEERQDNSEIEPLEPWSGDQIINYIITLLRNNNMNKKESKVINESIEIWLKSLKERVQPKQEWSEEDKKILERVINDIKSLKQQVYCKSACDEEIDWLKSLKPQNKWKPSDSDILLLERIANGKSNPQDFQASLSGLIGQLKKLKG